MSEETVIIKNRWGLGDGSPFVVPRHPDVLAEVQKAQAVSDKEEMRTIVCYLEHPEHRVRENMLCVLLGGQSDMSPATTVEAVVDRLADPSALIRSLAAQVLWKTSHDHGIISAVRVLRDEYQQKSLFGMIGLTMTPARALRGLVLLRNAAPTDEARSKFLKLVRKEIGIELE
jgi:hypothetical protein